jgi:hypothetical protein
VENVYAINAITQMIIGKIDVLKKVNIGEKLLSSDKVKFLSSDKILCPKGHKMEKMDANPFGKCWDDIRRGRCVSYNNCSFNYDVKSCFWCSVCHKHYRKGKPFIFR